MENFNVSEILNCYRANFNHGKSHVSDRRCHAIAFFYDAQSKYEYPGRTVKIESGYAMYLPKGRSYNIIHHKPCSIAVIDFELTSGTDTQPFSVKLDQSVGDSFALAAKIFSAKKPGYTLKLKSLIYKIFADIFATQQRNYLPSSKISKITPAQAYIDNHFNDASLCVDTLANMSGYSKRYFSDEFTKATGFAPGKYITLKRINHACKLLVETDKPISVISQECGISSEYYFSYLFKLHKDESPTQYRKSRRNI